MVMSLGRLGVWYAADKLDPPTWSRFIRRCEALGYSTLWYSESRGFESMSLASFLLAQTSTINVGSSIASIYARDAAASERIPLALATARCHPATGPQSWGGGRVQSSESGRCSAPMARA